MLDRPASSDLLDRIRWDAATRQLFDLIPGICFFIKDASGGLVYCNEEHRRGIFRYADADDLYGKENHDFFPATLASAFADDDRHVLRTGQPLIERVELNVDAAGLLCWYCTTKLPARDARGRVIGLLGISRRLEAADSHLADYALLSPALDFIHRHCAEAIQIGTLARTCAMTEATFRREFQRLFRTTPLRFIQRLRLHRACLRLANSTEPIGDLAYQCGFEDQNYFARYFKQTIGATPTEYRARHSSKNGR